MDDRKYSIEFKHGTVFVTKDEAAAIMESCRKALEEPKAKAWDFGFYCGQALAVRAENGVWSGGISAATYQGQNDAHVQILGNLKDIVENQGPIVVGMTIQEAYHLSCWASGSLADRLREVGDRYKNGKS